MVAVVKSVSGPKLVVHNVKLSFFYDLRKQQCNMQTIASGEWKVDSYSVTIYKCSRKYKSSKLRLINVTGIRSLEEIKRARSIIQERFNLKLEKHHRIDNIFASRRWRENFDVAKLIKTCQQLHKDKFFIFFDVLLSRGIYLIPHKKGTIPSFILFRTGSSTVMSIKSHKDLYRSEKLLKSIYTENNLKRSTVAVAVAAEE